jgi:hypothetical protein
VGDLQGAQWRKSTYSTDDGNCVEVASNLPGLIAVRDSKNPSASPLILGPVEWSAFQSVVKDGVSRAWHADSTTRWIANACICP